VIHRSAHPKVLTAFRDDSGVSSGTRGLIMHHDGRSEALADLSQVSDHIAAPSEIVWLDLLRPTVTDLAALKEEFRLHDLAIEDARLAHERPKLETYPAYQLVIVHTAERRDSELIVDEVAIFVGHDFVVTIRAHPALSLEEIERRWHAMHEALPPKAESLLYVILDVIVDCYVPIADSYGARVYALEQRIFEDGQDFKATLKEALAIKRELQRFITSASPLREVLVRLLRRDEHPTPPELIVYYNDLLDHVTRVIEQLENGQVLLHGAMDVHFSWQTEQQNEVLKQLTIVASIFLPLSFLTGFFGQNFEFMIDNIKSPLSFAVLGIGLQLATLGGLLIWFRRKKFV